jgi:hypothetical protein
MGNSLMERQSRRQSSRNRFLVWATAVLLLAAVMRLVLLQDVPPGLSQDEVLNADVVSFIRQGYHAIFFREGYGHEPLYHYWSVPFQVLFGDNVLSIRLPAAYLGLLLVAVMMRWAKREYGLVAAVAAGIGLAISWWPIIFSRVGLRPIMEPSLLLIFAWFWPRRPWLAGLFLGLSVYTYTGARVLFLLPLLLFLYWLVAGRWVDVPQQKLFKWQVPQPLASSLIVLLVSLLIVLPLTLTLWADPTLQQRVQQLEGPLNALQQGDLQPILATALKTLGVFSFNGDPRWTYTLPGRPLFDPLTVLFFYGGLLLSILRFKRPAYAFALIWLVVGLIPSAVTPQAPSTVRLVGAMPVIYLMPALALAWLWRRFEEGWKANKSRGRLMKRLLMILVGLLFLLNLMLTVRDGFMRWPQELETRLKYQSVWQDVADELRNQPEEGLVLADSFYRPITVDSLRRNLGYPLQARWVQTGSEVAGAVVLPQEGGGRLIVPEFAAPDPFLMETAGIEPEPLFRSEQEPSYAVYALPEEPALPVMDQEITFEDVITLVGTNTLLAPDRGSLQLVTIWRVGDTLPMDLAAFVHLRDEEGELISQHDGFDAAPETLRSRDLVMQRHVFPFGEPLSEGAYSLHIGLYTRENGQRLEHVRESSEITDQIVFPLELSAAE